MKHVGAGRPDGERGSVGTVYGGIGIRSMLAPRVACPPLLRAGGFVSWRAVHAA